MDDASQVPESELAVLRALWDRSPQTARELAETVYGGAGRTELGTVQKLLQRLETKAFVARERCLYAHRFTATISRDTFAGRQLENLAQKLTGGALAPFLTHFAERGRLSSADRKAILRLLEERGGRRKGAKK